MNAVILVGIQGSGKTTFYRERFFETHVRISLDMLRTRNRERILIDACIAAQQPFVVDNTNVLASDRAVYIGRARAAGFHVIGYFFPPELRASIKRNSIRKDKGPVPVPGVIGTYKRLQPPSLEEGLHELHEVRLNADGTFVVTPAASSAGPESGAGNG